MVSPITLNDLDGLVAPIKYMEEIQNQPYQFWFVDSHSQSDLILKFKHTSDDDKTLSKEIIMTNLFQTILRFLSATRIKWLSKNSFEKFLGDYEHLNDSDENIVHVYDNAADMKPLIYGEKAIIFTKVLRIDPIITMKNIIVPGYNDITWTILVNRYFNLTPKLKLNCGELYRYSSKYLTFAIVVPSSLRYSEFQSFDGLGISVDPIIVVPSSFYNRQTRHRLFSDFTQFDSIYVISDSGSDDGKKFILSCIKRDSPLNTFSQGINPLKTISLITYNISDNTPDYKYPELDILFRHSYWKKTDICDKRHKASFSTKNSCSKIIDWIDGFATSKYDLSALMESSPYNVPTVLSLNDINKLPPSDRYIIKRSGSFDTSGRNSLSFDIFSIDDIDKTRKRWTGENIVIQPLLVIGNDFIQFPGKYVIKIHGICYINSVGSIPRIVYLKRPIGSISTGSKVEISNQKGDDKIIAEGEKLNNLWPYIDPALKDFSLRQKKYFENSSLQGEKALLHFTADLIPARDDMTKFYLLEINRQGTVQVLGNRMLGNPRDLMDESLRAHEKLLRMIATDGLFSRLGPEWITYY